MANDEKENIDSTNNEAEVVETEEEILEEETTKEEVKDDRQDKPVETLEQRRARLLRQLNQTNKKLGIETPKKSKSDDFGYGEKAFLVANNIKEASEMELVKNIIQETGKTLEQVLDSKYFQAELKEMRELKATEGATPKSSKRAGQSAQDSVEYWLAKGELPPVSEVDLRRKVVNARIDKETKKGVFYNS